MEINQFGDILLASASPPWREATTIIKRAIPEINIPKPILPGVDGFEVLSQIKKDPSTAQVPVLILSNLGQKDDIERGLKLGAVDYLIKAQFTPGEIVKKIAKILKNE